MTVTYDYYFWASFGYVLAGTAAFAGFIWASIKWKQFGEIAWITVGTTISLLGLTCTLVQCSEMIARGHRQAVSDSKGDQPGGG